MLPIAIEIEAAPFALRGRAPMRTPVRTTAHLAPCSTTAMNACQTGMRLVLALVGLTLAACGKDSASVPAAPPPVPVHLVKVEPRTVPIQFVVPGQIEGSKQVEVRARVSGILQKQFYTEGDTVKQGAPLFEIDPAPFEVALAQAKGQLAQSTAQIDQARREETRLKPLVDERAVSRKEYDDATSSRQLAEASIQQANAAVRQAELNLSYTTVVAPVAGITGRAEHSVGTLITTDANGSLLTTLNVADSRSGYASALPSLISPRFPVAGSVPTVHSRCRSCWATGRRIRSRADSISPPRRSTRGLARSSCARCSTIRASNCFPASS